MNTTQEFEAVADQAFSPIGGRSPRCFVRSEMGEVAPDFENACGVALNLRFQQADIEVTMKRLADGSLPEFSGSGGE